MLDFIEENIWFDYFLRITASLAGGFCLGIERKMRQHTVGIRTLSLISISAALLSILSDYMSHSGIVAGDPTRITAGVVTGVGFLGAGTIVNQGLNIKGLTSAAIIFTAMALGATFGAGLYVPGIIVLIFSILTLFIAGKVEKLVFPAENRKYLELMFQANTIDIEKIKIILRNHKIILHDIDIKSSVSTKETTIYLTVKTPDSLDYISLTKQLSELPEINDIKLSKYVN